MITRPSSAARMTEPPAKSVPVCSLRVVQDRVEAHPERRGDRRRRAGARRRRCPAPCRRRRASCSDRLSICAPSWPDSAIRAWLRAMSLPRAACTACRAVERCAAERGRAGVLASASAFLATCVAGGDPLELGASTSSLPDDERRRAARRRGCAVLRPCRCSAAAVLGASAVVPLVPRGGDPLGAGHVVAHRPVELRRLDGVLLEPGHHLLLPGDLGDALVGGEERLARR